METTTMPAVSASAPRTAAGTKVSTRRAKLVVSKVDTWSVVRVTFLYSVCLFVILLVATATLWSVLNSAGVFDSVRRSAEDISSKPDGGLGPWLSLSRVLSMAALIGVANIILITALSAIGALLYNVCTDVVGGIEVTLSEQN
jgi:Transmembrane domain of unknown function (DUF3566)